MKMLGYLFGRDYAVYRTVKERLDLHDKSYIDLLDKICEQEKRVRLLELKVNGVDSNAKPAKNNPYHPHKDAMDLTE